MTRPLTVAATAAVLAAALMTSGCIMVNGADMTGDSNWQGKNAQPFDASRNECHRTTESHSDFIACMGTKGWTRS